MDIEVCPSAHLFNRPLIYIFKLLFISCQSLKNNGSLYAHTFFARSGYTPDPSDPEYQPLTAFARMHRITLFLIFPLCSGFVFHIGLTTVSLADFSDCCILSQVKIR